MPGSSQTIGAAATAAIDSQASVTSR